MCNFAMCSIACETNKVVCCSVVVVCGSVYLRVVVCISVECGCGVVEECVMCKN